MEAELVVIHCISLPPGEFGTPWPEALLAGEPLPDLPWVEEELRVLRVSAHLLILRDGSTVQFVPLHERAWHAGRSSWQGRPNCNDFSIGIELEGCETAPFADRQYDALAAVLVGLRSSYESLRHAPIVAHSDIAPGRKSDPGPSFSWARLARALKERSLSSP